MGQGEEGRGAKEKGEGGEEEGLWRPPLPATATSPDVGRGSGGGRPSTRRWCEAMELESPLCRLSETTHHNLIALHGYSVFTFWPIMAHRNDM